MFCVLEFVFFIVLDYYFLAICPDVITVAISAF